MQISLEKQGLNPGANWFQQLKKKVYGLNHNPKNRALGWFLVNRVELPGLVSLTNWSQLSTINITSYKSIDLFNKYQLTPSNYIYAPFDLILSFHLFYWKILYEYSFSSFFLYLVFFFKIKRKLFLNFHYFFFFEK